VFVPGTATADTGQALAADAVAPQPAPSAWAVPATDAAPPAQPWEASLEREALTLLTAGEAAPWDRLLQRFESTLIHAALEVTHGRRKDAAERLGIGRNTLTRKLQELGMEAQDMGKNGL